MKRRTLIILMMATGFALWSQGFSINAGVEAGTDYSLLDSKISGAEKYSINVLMLNFGVYADAAYARLCIDYSTSIGKPSVNISGMPVPSDSVSDQSGFSYIKILLLGKYPFSMGMMNVWPSLGIKYLLVLNVNEDNSGLHSSDQNADFSDLYAAGGIGADIKLGIFVLSPCLLFSYNLTPAPTKSPASGETDTQFDFEFTISFGYKFL